MDKAAIVAAARRGPSAEQAKFRQPNPPLGVKIQ
ncbi:Uncharacterised protein [Bordetella pertussis]|nr:Uncharacterised protein [Bordetella pertussis]